MDDGRGGLGPAAALGRVLPVAVTELQLDAIIFGTFSVTSTRGSPGNWHWPET